MSLMGRHSTPLAGVTIANGHSQATQGPPALMPFTIPQLQVRPRGPVAPWPQQSRWRHAGRVMSAHRAWLAAVPVILVNAVAFGAQLGFWRAHVPAASQAAVIALALETVAIYLAYQAHLAQLADDAALRLRLAAYGVAAGIGLLNYSHWDGPGWRPTVEAVTFGGMSAISPWLWSVHSRRVSRDALKATGQLEPHAVRLGMTRWTWHPVRAWRVMFRATWLGVTKPADAIALPPLATTADAPADAAESPVCDSSPDAPEHRRESVSGALGAAPEPASPDAKLKPRASASPPSKRAVAIAILKANPGVTDAEVMKRAKVSRSTVTLARRELPGAKS